VGINSEFIWQDRYNNQALMKKRKIRVGIIFGGRSAEHEVSLQSAKNIVEAIDKKKYEIVLIGIDKQGKWLLQKRSNYLLNTENPKLIKLNQAGKEVTIAPRAKEAKLVTISGKRSLGNIDIIFPVLHGPFGEDGTVQGLLKLANVPYVGPDILGSALGMDKDVQKRLLREAGIPVADFLVLTRTDYSDQLADKSIMKLGLPLFIKPANLGSSVGISKAKSKPAFKKAALEAFRYDKKIIAEEYVKGREIECSILGNENPIASIPGEVIPKHEFYSYEAKYIDDEGAILKIPAKLSKSLARKVQKIAIKAFKTLCCEGMARVDLFLTPKNKVYLNEINTIPGFTKISMYPKLWEASGISYTQLIDKLISLAIKRHRRDKKLKTSYIPQ
jgi:D-alanine-D-alanine ligase